MATGRERFYEFMEETEREQEKEKVDDGYDSDDPESWGPYYWSTDENGTLQKIDASAKDKVVDNIKYYSFKASRGVNFAGEVLINFFGLDQSKYQWMIDQIEREQHEEEEARLHFEQREELKRKKNMEKEKEEIEALEGGT
uniref:Uncharacterized protein n=1 Tax=Aplanochytrium stocchinoi TaxID=215587 RepID=A0A7S3PRD9_9STRA|mmetsp:Transcript_22921/g.28114  ORF Transcript_22921/g.28114 Transcript_22921/m.28114 type:complete len:141 (-) Transcript_22921:1366-1788(-)